MRFSLSQCAFLRRLPAFAALCVACLLAPSRAHADVVDRCADASESGQRLRDERRLIEAREQFIACSQSACPDLIRADCLYWLDETKRRIPSLVPRAKDGDGRDLTDVTLSLDGRELVAPFDGRAIEVDPGTHKLVFEVQGASPVVVDVVAHDGEQRRFVDAVIGARAGEPTSKAVPAGVWVLGSVGVVGLASFAVFGTRAKSEVDDMRSSCAPYCSEQRVDDARRDAWIANGSLGVAVVAIGVGAWLLLDTASDEPSVETGEPRIMVLPTRSGAIGGVSLSFE